MYRSTLVLALVALSVTTATATSPALPYREAPRSGHWIDDLSPRANPTRNDTVWFGGVDEDGLAVEGGVWDFEDNTFQGITVLDQTDNGADYFEWVTLASFATDEFPPGSEAWAPMINNTTGMIWCGIHTEDARSQDYLNGLGYGDRWCQTTRSPLFGLSGPTRVNLSFDYFSWTEEAHDSVYVSLLPYAGMSGDSLLADQICRLEGWDGVEDEHGDYTDPASRSYRTRPLDLPAEATGFRVEFLFVSDGEGSDEDGSVDCPYGPCAFDNVQVFTEDDPPSVDEFYDFDAGPQGWAFERCPPAGTYMQLVDEIEANDWMLNGSGIICPCGIEGKAIAFNNMICEDGYPGISSGTYNAMLTPVIPRDAYQAPMYDGAVYQYDQYTNLPLDNGCLYQIGYQYWPYQSEVNPEDHWSPFIFPHGFWYSATPWCDRWCASMDLLPVEWDSLRFVYEVLSSCEDFGIPPTICTTPGCGVGSPVLDNIRVGLTGPGVDAPVILPAIGHLFMDGFGQRDPMWLNPADVGNANITYDASLVNWESNEENDWNLDSSVVRGPLVTGEENEWLAELCFRIARVGPRQEMIPGYQAWKSRLPGDPESDWVCALMDSAQAGPSAPGVSESFASYFHENDPAFDPAHPDYTTAQEILPDSIFTPGTEIHYYWRSFYYRGGTPPEDYYKVPGDDLHYEFAILPGMEIDPEYPELMRWPSVLYIDAFNRGAEPYVTDFLDQEGIAHDRFDYQDPSSSWHAPMKRNFGGVGHNPGGWSNSGCTAAQLRGYRMILLNTGDLGNGAMEPNDFDLFSEWMESTEGWPLNTRGGFIADGSEIADIMTGYVGIAAHFAYDLLGVDLVHESYREYNQDPSPCVQVDPVMGAVFAPDSEVRVHSNGCPRMRDYNVVGVYPASDAIGNMDWFSYLGQGTEDYVDFAQVVRDQVGGQNIRTVTDGFSLHHLSQVGCPGEIGDIDCREDSLCIALGLASMLRPAIEWIEDDADPFVMWRYDYPCMDVDDEDVSHLSGPVDYLHPARPNPFHARATIRFHLAKEDRVAIEIFDVAGRSVRRLVQEDLEAGEHSVVWEGTDTHGHPVGSGIYWVQMTTDRGYASSKRMLVMR